MADDLEPELIIRPVVARDWELISWLWQLCRHDLATVVGGLPYGDGRYQHRDLDRIQESGGLAYVAFVPHPRTGDLAPVAFVVIEDSTTGGSNLAALWVAPPVRGKGIGRQMAVFALAQRPGEWAVAFQHDNVTAGQFWCSVANTAFGPGKWLEVRKPVLRNRDAPADHVITGTFIPAVPPD